MPNTKAAPVQPVGPWREGRPSFKAFRPEVCLLAILTIACLAVAFKWGWTASNPAAPTPTATAATENAVASAEAENVGTAPNPKGGSKILWIWLGCLSVPAIFWIWRGWAWICAIYGVKYKLVIDENNPRATTFLITRGVLNKKTDSLHIAQIKDVSNSQTLIQKYLQGGVGTIILYTSDVTDQTVAMKNMDEPNRVFNAFDELRRVYWSKGGVALNAGADGFDGGDGTIAN